MPDVADTRARYRRILRFAARHLVQTWWFELFLPRIGLARIAERTRDRRMRNAARRFRTLAVELGGLMIKVGQFLSSRLDVLPPEVTNELAGLQDEVPAVPFPAIRMLAEAELGGPLEHVFVSFDPVPVAAASLGQAHRAVLAAQDAADVGFDGVVVKVQRPGIDAIIEVDLAALRRVGVWLSRVRVVADRVDMPTLIEEFAATSLQEVDYLHEAVNAERFAEDFADDPRVAAPAVVWERTTRRVLTLADVTAIKITDVDGLRAAGIDPSEVAAAFASVMFDQFFSHGFFHADPHPGNIFVTPLPEGTDAGGLRWRLTFVDFGMMGEVTDRIRGGLRKLLIAVAARDSRALVQSVREVGVLLPSADTGELERAMTQLFSRFGGMGFSQLREVDPREFQDFAVEFGDVIRSLPFQLPENFLLVIRAMSLTSGVCSALDPDFNMWDAVEPYANRLARDEGGNAVRDAARQAMGVAGAVWRLPQRLENVLELLEQGRIAVDMSPLERRLDRLQSAAVRILAALIFAVLMVAGVILRRDDMVFGVVFMIASVVPLLYAVFGGIRRRRR